MTRSLPALLKTGLGLTLVLAAAGCASMNLDLVAPPPSTASPELARGRLIYVTKCAKCHAPEPVKRYSREKWHEIMPEMVEETHLSPADTAAVTAYVHWVLKQ